MGVFPMPDGNTSFRKLLIDIHIYFWLKGNILVLVHLTVLLFNKYEISSIYGDNHAQTVEIGKRGDALRYHPGIKNLIKKI
jgi:hypothetical protein